MTSRRAAASIGEPGPLEGDHLFSSYRRLFAAPGAAAFTLAALPARMAISMFGVSVVIMVASLRDSYALAGSVSAAGLVVTALLAPWIARWVDRYGQSRVVVPTALFSGAGAAALVICAGAGAPVWTLFAANIVAAANPNVGSMVRARWVALHRDRPDLLHTANALEQTIDELCFMTGPVIAAFLCTAVAPQAGLTVTIVLFVTGSLALAAQRRTEPAVHGVRERGRSPLRQRGVLEIVVTFLFTGAVFGSVEVVTVAYAESLGHPSSAGVILGLFAGGSAVAGLVFGTLRVRGAAAARFLICVTAMAVLIQPVLLAGNLWALAAVLFVAGLATAPTMITSMTLVHELVPSARINEGMTLTVTGLLIGVSAGASIGGWTVEAAGAHAGYVTPTVAAGLALVAALIGFGPAVLRSRRAAVVGGPQERAEARGKPGG
ncbi:MFS transporter [Actinoplanes lobatus]|uniref:MFS family permease n=1 Tax=Actinoplanes lobatus TaxID=113568 RepID=A0A7W7HMT6_9ACTN|nr:MFS transporter [Actinoplanes lobatus]MBB4753410.1 MFS family permease [Actinoplanes lobatus]